MKVRGGRCTAFTPAGFPGQEGLPEIAPVGFRSGSERLNLGRRSTCNDGTSPANPAP